MSNLNPDLMRIVGFIDRIADVGSLERFFRPEGKINDNVCALPVVPSKLRLYCLRLSDKILILGNGSVKKTRTYNEDDELKGYVLTLQKFDKLIKEGVEDSTITVTENTLDTDKTLTINTSFRQMVAAVPAEITREVDLEFAISNRIYELMTKRSLSKVEFAQALGKRPSEITKWLSGQHNFTLRTISLLSVFIGEPLITID